MSGTQSVSISPEQLRKAAFSTEHEGYDRNEVRALLSAAADALELAWREKNDLTAGLTADDTEISSRAVLLLSSAQRIADDAVAEAEAYSKDLIETARKQYREIVERAQQAAHNIEKQAGAGRASEAPAEPSASGPAASPAPSAAPQGAGWSPDQSPAAAFATDDLAAAGPASPEDVVRARQFTRMAAAQAHSLLESIERELARLGVNPHE
jgi:cell division septum initiation protein DivIVA